MKTQEGADGVVPLWAWLAQVDRHLKRKLDYYDKDWSESMGKFLGLEISEFTRGLASLLYSIESQQRDIEVAMLATLRSEAFKPYFRVLRRFNFCDQTCCFIIALVFPIV